MLATKIITDFLTDNLPMYFSLTSAWLVPFVGGTKTPSAPEMLADGPTSCKHQAHEHTDGH